MTDPTAEIRDAVRAPCTGFPDEHHRKVDEQGGGCEAAVPTTSTSGVVGNPGHGMQARRSADVSTGDPA
jgi:hypothetical protein